MPTTDFEEATETVLSSLRDSFGALRARLYRMDSAGTYRLAASSGFTSRFLPGDVLTPGTPLLEWVRRTRKPAFANSPREAGIPLARAMEREQYARALAAPVYVGSRLAGLLELQDKERGGIFTHGDLARLEGPLSRLRALLTEHDTTSVAAPEAMAPEDAERIFLEPPRPADRFPPPPPLFHVAAEEGDASGARRTSAPAHLTRRDFAVFRGFASALLLGPDVLAVIFSFWSRAKAELHVSSRRPLSEEARAALVRDLEKALSAASPELAASGERTFHSDYPLGREPGEIRETAGTQTSAVETSRDRALLFSILFARAPSPEQTEALRETHRLVRSAVGDARAAGLYRASYRSLVNALIEPGTKPYPQLKAHSLAVGLLSRRLAETLRLCAGAVEQVTVAGLLHDIGLKELPLPYESLSGRRPLDAQEIAVVRGHPAAGEDVLRRIEFPYPVAPLVRHHHERFDGGGYPDRLAGEKIPLGSRIIAIAEAWDAMTAEHSYRAPIAQEDALQIILRKGGTQFDPDLVLRFRDLMREPRRKA